MEITSLSYSTWIQPLKIAEVKENVVRIWCEISGAQEYIETKYKKPLEAAMKKIVGEVYQVEILDKL